MTAAELLAAARRDGVAVALSSDESIKLAGHRLAVKRWLPLLRPQKDEILRLLEEEAQRAPLCEEPLSAAPGAPEACAPVAAGQTEAPVATPILPTKSWTFEDDRITCPECRNLLPNGRCAAAARGELNAIRTYEPPQYILQRCAGYLPGPDDKDQRTGRERKWPGGRTT